MTRLFFAVLCAAIFILTPLARAQDHNHQHAPVPEVFAGKKVEGPACDKGECPMKEGRHCGCCKDGNCPMMTGKDGGHGQHAMSAAEPTGDLAIDELNSAMARMHADMAVTVTGDPDADFIRGMIPHHQGAIDMAQIVLKHGDDPETRALARTIIRAQKGEIALMRRWLERRQLPEKEPIDLRR